MVSPELRVAACGVHDSATARTRIRSSADLGDAGARDDGRLGCARRNSGSRWSAMAASAWPSTCTASPRRSGASPAPAARSTTANTRKRRQPGRLPRAARGDRGGQRRSGCACWSTSSPGASAGGINGVFLAQAIATGQSLDPLTDLWLDSADVEALIDPDARRRRRASPRSGRCRSPGWRRSAAATTIDEPVEAGAREEVRAKLSHFVRSRWFEPPFGGERFTGLLLDALDAMAAAPRGAAPAARRPAARPVRHRHRFSRPSRTAAAQFAARGDRDRASPGRAVHRSRRAASRRSRIRRSWPSPRARRRAFPAPFRPSRSASSTTCWQSASVDWPGRDAFLARVLPQHRPRRNAAEKAVLIDGSVLANAPFRPAIEALRERPARRQIDRRFVYIDPSPGAEDPFRRRARRKRPASSRRSSARSPNCRASSRSATISRRSPSDRDADRADAIDHRRYPRPRSKPQVEALFGYTLFLDSPTPARLAAWRAPRAECRRGQGRLQLCRLRPLKLTA